MKQAPPIHDDGIELLLQRFAPDSLNAPPIARDERHITLEDLDGMRAGLERYEINRDAPIGGHSYEFSELYAEHRDWQKKVKVINDLFNQYVMQTEDIRENEKLMRETRAIIKLVQCMIRDRDERAAKFETALYVRKQSEVDWAEPRERNDEVEEDEDEESEATTLDLDIWLKNAAVLWEEDSQTVANVDKAFRAVRRGEFPNILKALNIELPSGSDEERLNDTPIDGEIGDMNSNQGGDEVSEE